MRERIVEGPEEMMSLGAELRGGLHAGDVVFLEGPLGAGKTTLVRGLLRSLGVTGAVRSPTFNLLQTFPTDPPVLHADLYRVASAEGLGIEDYLDSHLVLIEWPEHAASLVDSKSVWRVSISFSGTGRLVRIDPPGAR